MSTKYLATPVTATPTRLFPDSDRGVTEIEIPAGESAFLIFQRADDTPEQHYVFHLRHPESRISIKALIEAVGESDPRLSTTVVHYAPHTQAETIVRTLARDAAQPRYEGLIRIERSGQGSESFLNHHSLLLGAKAKSWTLPSLEIKADQVKCSHAATLRSLTDLDLFYARSRGLEKAAAEQLLIEAFLADIQ